ncbi:MAG: hypothetical protein ACKV2V_20265 [Blastocatellia bacterium]
MNLEQMFGDLTSVPGVSGAMYFQQRETPQLYWPEDSTCPPPGDRFLRGASQIIRRLCDAHNRIELRYQQGRFFVQSLGGGTAIACFAGRELNLPLLNLTMDDFVREFASQADVGVGASISGMGSGMGSGTAAQAGRQGHGVAGAQPDAGVVEETFAEPLVTHASIAAGLSDISMIATGYLGRGRVISCWTQTEPDELLSSFHISSDGMIESVNDLAPSDPEVIAAASTWARAFIRVSRLAQVDLPLQLIAPLNADAHTLLAGDAASGDRGLILLQESYMSQLLADADRVGAGQGNVFPETTFASPTELPDNW